MATINEKDCTGPWEIEEHISDLFQKLSTHWKTQQWPILRANQLKLFRDKILVWIKETEESFMALTTHTVFETSHTDFHSSNKPISADQCSDLEGVDQKSEPYSPLATTKEESVLEIINLMKMEKFVFVDLTQYPFFNKFSGSLSDKTFVYGIARPKTGPKLSNFGLFKELNDKKCVYISTDVGTSKKAVAFALAMLIPKMDERVPASVPFFVISNSDGLNETARQLDNVRRKIKVLNLDPTKKVTEEEFTI